MNAALLIVLAVVIAAALAIGPERVDWRGLVAGTDLRAHAIVFISRLPRILLAATVGLALSTAGASYQALRANAWQPRRPS